ncbi:CbtA family protein [Thiohalobacter sp. IOR34]|uniref:CbtA family protein n=1 Tax=Thiohalobacter sp. IOR34 TaxID=3057176 RepID=UPI0025B0785D|nr:CbtA family protein [Thiohalobacter sp. IOR34]WJW75708.1 CbtA family protein [Thiohalobacter sp. IOR34]
MTGSRFRRLFTAAAFAALSAGLLLTLLQQIEVVPAILEAETYEAAAGGAAHDHPAAADHGHGETEDGWQPEDGMERLLFTAAANLVIALGFALLLGAAITLRGTDPDWRSGLAWGAAGFVVFYLAPTLGLPPELPGTEAAALRDRQLWWTGAAAATAAGLALLVFGRGWIARAGGAALLALPHLAGAPRPEVHQALAPEALIDSFETAALLTNAAFWLALGGLYGFFHRRLSP